MEPYPRYVYWIHHDQDSGWTTMTSYCLCSPYSPPQPGYWLGPHGYLPRPIFSPPPLGYSPFYFRPDFLYMYSSGGPQFGLHSPIMVKALGFSKEESYPNSDGIDPLDPPDAVAKRFTLRKSNQKDSVEILHVNVDDPRVYQTLLDYIPTMVQLKNLGYPMGTPNKTTVFVQSTGPQPKKDDGERNCSRCARTFNANPSNYSTERCRYHCGRCTIGKRFHVVMTCCKGSPQSPGCTVSKRHVWCGWTYGVNRYSGFAKTYARKTNRRSVFAVDCEMCYTLNGMEVIRVTLVELGGEVVYDTLVRPQGSVIDYNTEYSGIAEEHFLFGESKSFQETRDDLLAMIDSTTILIGHGLENDLRVLKILHFHVVDTSVIYPHHHGFPCRRALRDIAKEVLGVKIQQGTGTSGHDSREDATTCLRLVLRKLQDDYNVIIEK